MRTPAAPTGLEDEEEGMWMGEFISSPRDVGGSVYLQSKDYLTVNQAALGACHSVSKQTTEAPLSQCAVVGWVDVAGRSVYVTPSAAREPHFVYKVQL